MSYKSGFSGQLRAEKSYFTFASLAGLSMIQDGGT